MSISSATLRSNRYPSYPCTLLQEKPVFLICEMGIILSPLISDTFVEQVCQDVWYCTEPFILKQLPPRPAPQTLGCRQSRLNLPHKQPGKKTGCLVSFMLDENISILWWKQLHFAQNFIGEPMLERLETGRR